MTMELVPLNVQEMPQATAGAAMGACPTQASTCPNRARMPSCQLWEQSGPQAPVTAT